jgi:hypothetical protein
VVVVSHHPGQNEDRDQERAEQHGSPCNPPIVPHQIGGNSDNQAGRRRHDAQLPGPEHKIQMILAADFTPNREDRLHGNEEFDDQQWAEKTIVHVSVK